MPPGTATAPVFTYNHQQHLVAERRCPVGVRRSRASPSTRAAQLSDQLQRRALLRRLLRGCIWAMFPGGNGIRIPAQIAASRRVPGGPGRSRSRPGRRRLLRRFRRRTDPAIRLWPERGRDGRPDLTGGPPLTVHFDGTGSTDPAGRRAHLRLGSRRRRPVQRRSTERGELRVPGGRNLCRAAPGHRPRGVTNVSAPMRSPRAPCRPRDPDSRARPLHGKSATRSLFPAGHGRRGRFRRAR